MAEPRPLVGRRAELACSTTLAGGDVGERLPSLFVVGEPGLGKTRLVHECRKLLWPGSVPARPATAVAGRPLRFLRVLDALGLYRQLLSAWVGATSEEGEDVVRAALERAMKAVLRGPTRPRRRSGPDDGAIGLAKKRPAWPGSPPSTCSGPRSCRCGRLDRTLGSKGPTVLVLEDLHWADPTSLAAHGGSVSASQRRPPVVAGPTRRLEPDPGVSAFEVLALF